VSIQVEDGMHRRGIVLVVLLGAAGAFVWSRMIPSAIADASQRALVGQWVAADANDASALVFMSDGSWALATDGKVTATGEYSWISEDSIKLSFVRQGKSMEMTWRVWAGQDALEVEEKPGRVVKWFRYSAPSRSPAPEQNRTNSQLATVEFDGAVVGLTKADGSTWDWSAVTSISAEDRKRFESAVLKASAKAAATDPLAAAAGVVAALGAAVIDAKAKPDPMGTVELMIDGQTVGGARGRIVLPRQLDTYTPSWNLGPWTHVPLDGKHDVRLRLHLEDYDPELLGGNDQIGTVMVNSDDFLRAARLRKVLPVYVGDQSQKQLVFVNVSVTMEASAGR
jgi:hypothetical protein